MQADFTDANERHWYDAELLLERERLANADHLYGFSAECGLKALMIAFGMPCDETGSPQKRNDWKHIDQLSVRYESYRSGGEFSDYCCDNLDAFTNWHTGDRYANQVEFNAEYVHSHRIVAQAIRSLVEIARKRGIIE
ncbi:TPA: SAM-dependent methyltransferase [Serratia odorifera]